MDNITLTVDPYQFNLIGTALRLMRDQCTVALNGMATLVPTDPPPPASPVEDASHG